MAPCLEVMLLEERSLSSSDRWADSHEESEFQTVAKALKKGSRKAKVGTGGRGGERADSVWS